MSNLVVSASFTDNLGTPATGLTLTDIDISLSSVNKSTGAVAAVWATENPTAEVSNVGAYIKVYASADFDTYDYVATANYTGGSTLDCDDVGGAIGSGVTLDNNAITAAKIATDAIDAGAIAADAIGQSELASTAVAEIADAVWDEAQADHVTAATFGLIASEIASILADTGTDGVVLATDSVSAAAVATAAAQEIADEILKRGVDNVEDTADATSLAGLILAAFESVIASTTWTIKKTDGTTFTTKTVSVDASADPIIGVT
jgi:hypothetical protein